MSPPSRCDEENGGYRAEYAAFLRSQVMNAPDTLQPVLVLAWHGIDANSTERSTSQLTTWAEQQGAIVINIDAFSFQAELDQRNVTGGILGAFIRLDIPSLVEEHHLFARPNICKPEVLYTDSDGFFMNRISAEYMQYVKQAVHNSAEIVVAYGAESQCNASEIVNTGVMIMHVDRFRAEWPKMLEFAMAEPKFPVHDQALLNA